MLSDDTWLSSAVAAVPDAHKTTQSSLMAVSSEHGCQMAKFDPFLSLDCARVEGVGAQSKERKGSNFDIWQPCSKDTAISDDCVVLCASGTAATAELSQVHWHLNFRLR